jgi:hypothetical protein
MRIVFCVYIFCVYKIQVLVFWLCMIVRCKYKRWLLHFLWMLIVCVCMSSILFRKILQCLKFWTHAEKQWFITDIWACSCKHKLTARRAMQAGYIPGSHYARIPIPPPPPSPMIRKNTRRMTWRLTVGSVWGGGWKTWMGENLQKYTMGVCQNVNEDTYVVLLGARIK